jgi:hypothetical protein
MVINIVRLAGKLIQHPEKFLTAHLPREATVAMAKATVHIANICNFNICS